MKPELEEISRLSGRRALVHLSGGIIYHAHMERIEITNSSVIFVGHEIDPRSGALKGERRVYKVVSSDFEDTLMEEYRIMRKLARKCPHIILSARDMGMVSTYRCMVLEYMPMDLFTFIDTHILDMHELCGIFYKLCGTVAVLHDQGYIHGDIKMENVLVNYVYESGVPVWDCLEMKLCDFGNATEYIAEGEPDYTKLKLIHMGTLQYAPWEVLRNQYIENYLLPRVDIYALGHTLYAMITKKFLYTSSHPNGIMYEMGNMSLRELLNPFNNDPELKQLLLGMLVLNNKGRYIMNLVLNSDWFIKNGFIPPAKSVDTRDDTDTSTIGSVSTDTTDYQPGESHLHEQQPLESEIITLSMGTCDVYTSADDTSQDTISSINSTSTYSTITTRTDNTTNSADVTNTSQSDVMTSDTMTFTTPTSTCDSGTPTNTDETSGMSDDI